MKLVQKIGQTRLTTQEAISLYDGPSPIQQLTQYTYDSYDNVIEKDETDYYTCTSNPCTIPTQSTSLPAPSGGWLRKTFTTYNYSNNSAWVTLPSGCVSLNRPGLED